MWTPLKTDDTPEMAELRRELIQLCEDAVVPMQKWSDRDSARSHTKLGTAWALLRAGAPFELDDLTDDRMWWITIRWEDFNRFELGDDAYPASELFYLPTRAWLDETAGRDWYC